MSGSVEEVIGATNSLLEKIKNMGIIESSTHTPVYMMHKFWARRPWRVFRELIEKFTSPGDIILDPFAGGGVTLVEGLIAKRRVVAVDINPLAVLVMRHEVAPLDIAKFEQAISYIEKSVGKEISKLYSVRCTVCRGEAEAEWIEYDSNSDKPLQIQFRCNCGYRGRKTPEPCDIQTLPKPRIERREEIPRGDKTDDLLKKGYRYFDELFTNRNLTALLMLRRAILSLDIADDVRSFLLFTFSSTLKWASKMNHRRGEVIEGWAMHAYWVYPKYLEINVWGQFLNRARAVMRGKKYTNEQIGRYAVEASSIDDLKSGRASYLILQTDARNLPLPENSIDTIITDPPYGDNVNYAELSDYFLWWNGKLSPKKEEIIINRTRGFSLEHYQKGLEEVFKECNRVQRPGGLLISTFNSKDVRVVAAFLSALQSSGYLYIGTSYQPYLKVYETTFHALQVDSLPFDFVFFFKKPEKGLRNIINQNNLGTKHSLGDIISMMREDLKRCKNEECTEREYRIRTYRYLIDTLVTLDKASSKLLAKTYEDLINDNINYFKTVRRKIVEMRRNSKSKRIEDYG